MPRSAPRLLHDGEQGGEGADGGRDGKRHVRDGVVGKQPAKPHDDGLDHQQQMVVQGERFAVPRKQNREHEKGVEGAAQAENRTDGVVLYRLFLGQVVKTEKNCRSECQNQP